MVRGEKGQGIEARFCLLSDNLADRLENSER
jgi:hypothetical protein